jgi:hypothetical protein
VEGNIPNPRWGLRGSGCFNGEGNQPHQLIKSPVYLFDVFCEPFSVLIIDGKLGIRK